MTEAKSLEGWVPPPAPERAALVGEAVSLEPVDPTAHRSSLFEAAQGDGADPRLWDYMSVGPFSEDEFSAWLLDAATSTDPLFFSIVDAASGEAVGMASYMRITPDQGVIEIGFIWFGHQLQRTKGATEAIYLLARHAMDDLGYRRFEWKCDSLNALSRAAALRFGFTFEGIFRNHMVIKERNRDTAWFSITDEEWPAIRSAFETWLSPENFDSTGTQIQPLGTAR